VSIAYGLSMTLHSKDSGWLVLTANHNMLLEFEWAGGWWQQVPCLLPPKSSHSLSSRLSTHACDEPSSTGVKPMGETLWRYSTRGGLISLFLPSFFNSPASTLCCLFRSSILNHTSSMVELARLLLNEPLVTHPQQLEQAVTLPGASLAHHTALAATGNTTHVANITVGLLHHILLQQRNAFMPPVAGPTACTGLYRRSVPALMQNVSNSTAVVPTGRSTQAVQVAHQRRQQGLSEAGASSVQGDAAGLVVLRARRAAVAWLFEASSVGDAEASALLGWLWHDGVLQGSRAQQEALAVITRWATRSRRYCHDLHNLPTSFSSQLVSTGTLDNIKATCQALRMADSLGPQRAGQACNGRGWVGKRGWGGRRG
jgi:hypothetical protein